MKQLLFAISLCLSMSQQILVAQEVLNHTLLQADKHYIQKKYSEAVIHYKKYLQKYPRDYYASRQAAICYDRLNEPDNAIDYWPVVVESSEVTEKDYLAYGKSLLANNRLPEAKSIFLYLSKSQNKSVAEWGKAYKGIGMSGSDTNNIKVIELDGTNTDLSEADPVVFNEKLFYISGQLQKGRPFHSISELNNFTIKVCVIKDSLHFLSSLLYERLQTLQMSGPFCFSPDGKSLYFSKVVSNTVLNIKSEEPFFRHQIFVLDLNSLFADKLSISPFIHNQNAYDMMHPCMSKDGKKLYFASNIKGSMGGNDLFFCEWKNNGWNSPVNLGTEVNSPGNEVFPTLSDKGNLYFASDQRPGLGGLDIFCAKLDSTENKYFHTAENLKAPINSRFDDFGLYVIKDLKSGYFSSNRKENKGDDLYYFYLKD